MAYHDPDGNLRSGPGPDIQFQVFRIKPWQMWLGGAIALALGIGLALLATSILLIAVPVALVAGLAWRLFGKPVVTRNDGVIEADYRRIEPERLPRRDAEPPR
jgi:hypothetical protein